MTVADNTSRNQYTATSGQTVFAYTFEIVDKDDVVVLKNGTTLSEGTDYTVSNVGNDSGGNVTLTVGATAGDILTLYRDMPYSRTQNYTNSGDFLASEVNSDFDNLWLAGEQTNRAFSQSIRKPITDSDSISMELPEAATRADRFLTFDSTGAVTTTAVSSATAPQNIYRQQMTGDGTSTAFTLNFDSGSVGGAIVIYIDGVYQEGDTYNASGTSLVFTEAPPTNASIEVMYFKVSVAADIDTTGTIYSQQFTGNGSTTAYTLGIPPGSTGKALQIFINGVYQDQGSYTVSGATLTFSEAPPTTSQIDVIAFRIKEIGATDANLVTYTPAGTGAVPITVQTKLRETVSVKDFGAVGDGVTDDTAAIQAALDYGDVVHIPQGTYLFSALNLPYSTTLRGDGPKNTILKSSASSGTAITFVDDPSVDGNFWNSLENLTLDATTARQAGTGDGIVVDCGDNTKTAFQAHIINVVVQNQPGVGVKYVQPEECHVVVVTQQNGGKGFLVTSPDSRGISNDFQVRAINNEDVAIDVDTNHSEFRSCEALVQGDSPVFTGILFDVDGFGNVITCPDIELNQNPSDSNIQAMTGIDLRGSNNTVIGGFIGNCGTSVVIGGQSNKVDRVRTTIFSTSATNPVSGSKGIELLSGTTDHHVEFSGSGVSKIETEIDDSSDDSVIVRDGEVNGLGKVLTATTTWDPPAMGVGGMQVTSIAVTDASIGSPCIVGHTGLTSGIGGNNKVQLTGFTVNGFVFVQMKNESGSILNVPSGTLTVKVFES